MIGDPIYDVGLADGSDTAYYLSKNLRVLAIEANPIAVKNAREKFADAVKTKRLTILNIGISREQGLLPFWICDTKPEKSSFHQSIPVREGLPYHEISVECRPFSSVLDEFGVPRYLKMDIEANEIHCLRDLSPADLPEYISFEKSGYEKQELRLLRELGYTHFKIVSQFHFLPVEFPPSSEQRRYETACRLVNSRNFFVCAARKLGMRHWLDREVSRPRIRAGWSFPMGSSGPLGNETARENGKATPKFSTPLREPKQLASAASPAYSGGPKNRGPSGLIFMRGAPRSFARQTLKIKSLARGN
jgi:FkbM family methyltransferase